jgi:TrmH family RNA methyltransferase
MSLDKNITSIKDERVIEARSLQTSTGRLAAQKFLLEGIEPILWSIDSPCQLQHVFAHDKLKDHPGIEKLKSEKVPVYFVSDGILKKITDTSYLSPFVGVANFPKQISNQKSDLVVVLDGVSDFGNIGTIVRTAAAFGIREFISTEDNQDFFYKKTIDASRGTVFSSHLKRFKSGTEAVQHLKQQGYQIAVTTPYNSVIQSFAQIEEKPIAIVLGNETNGVSQEVSDLADIKIQIPMSGAIESLNVGVAAGISLFEMKIKWVLMMLTKKIQESLGRHLYCASKWIRLVFDAKLKEVSPFNADQAIMMMILKCDGGSDAQKLAHDAGLSPGVDVYSELNPLLKQGIIEQKDDQLTLSEKGEEMIAKIWSVHELSEQIAFNGITEEEKEYFIKTIEKISKNCEKIVPFS